MSCLHPYTSISYTLYQIFRQETDQRIIRQAISSTFWSNKLFFSTKCIRKPLRNVGQILFLKTYSNIGKINWLTEHMLIFINQTNLWFIRCECLNWKYFSACVGGKLKTVWNFYRAREVHCNVVTHTVFWPQLAVSPFRHSRIINLGLSALGYMSLTSSNSFPNLKGLDALTNDISSILFHFICQSRLRL